VNSPTHTPAPKPVSVRAQTAQLVATVASQAKEARHQVYGRVYTRLGFLYGIDIHKLPRNKGESLLLVAEQHDLIDKVYALAYAEHLYLLANEE